ncbi:N-acetylmuramoyl-L-alanine amidase [Streptomyces antibioticus]|uniref:N-acetylmuramoyl-L-alanine amidase n=1 Tax=Streptomyces antibioticus TaxID=1890 RepID=UPI0036FE78A9
MATGPQRYPGASTAYWYQNDFGGSAMEVNAVVLHTTEGRTLPSYGGGGSAPTLTAVPDFAARKLKWYQHFDIDTSARALVNRPGGVETNTLNVCQVELVGTCDPSTRSAWIKQGLVQDRDFVYWPKAPSWLLAAVAAFLAWMHAEHEVPLTGPAKWPAYPGSYGNGGGQRMTFAQWSAFRGVCGHMHVPENSHGDPGAIDFTELLALAKNAASTPEPPVTEPAPAKPKVSLAHILAAARKDPAAAQGHTTHKTEVLLVERALKAEGLLAAKWVDGSFGTKTVAAYARWQRSAAGGGFTGTDADGIPGKTSLKLLAARHGFTVTT